MVVIPFRSIWYISMVYNNMYIWHHIHILFMVHGMVHPIMLFAFCFLYYPSAIYLLIQFVICSSMNKTAGSLRHSGLQKEVIYLYRTLIRSARKKNDPSFSQYVKSKFRSDAESVSKKDFLFIEHYIRHGNKQLALIERPGFSTASYYKG